MLGKFWSLRNAYTAYEMYSLKHFMLVLVCTLFICLALYMSRSMDKNAVKKAVGRCMWLMVVFELGKVFYYGVLSDLSYYMPLYYCSIILFAGWFSAYGKGRLKRMSDVFIMVGGIIGGLVYFVSPMTTAGRYPVFHFMTMQSFLHHSIMIYLGMLFIITDYIELRKSDLINYAIPVLAMSLVAYVINLQRNTNYMYISKSTGMAPIEFIYNLSPQLFSVIMIAIQAIAPFYVIYGILQGCKKIK